MKGYKKPMFVIEDEDEESTEEGTNVSKATEEEEDAHRSAVEEEQTNRRPLLPQSVGHRPTPVQLFLLCFPCGRCCCR